MAGAIKHAGRGPPLPPMR